MAYINGKEVLFGCEVNGSLNPEILNFVQSSQYLNGTYPTLNVVDGQYVYLGTYSNVYKIDFSIESNPVESVHIPLNNKMSCTGIAVKGNYVYACYRDGSSGLNRDESIAAGMLYIFNKDTLSTVKSITLDWKATRIIIHENIMIVNLQLKGWDLYDISDPTNPIIKYSYRVPDDEFDEYQGGTIYEKDNDVFYVSGSYGVGLHFFKITDMTAPVKISDFLFKWFSNLSNKVHTYDVIVEYPYVYATIATTSAADYGTENDYRGIFKIDISDFSLFTNETANSIPFYISKINAEDLPSTKTAGDSMPTKMIKYKNFLISNTGRNGVAVFDVSLNTPIYQRVIETTDEGIPFTLTKTNDNRVVFSDGWIEKYVHVWRPIF